jgi:two-component system, response regulator PdtaR
MVFRERTYSVLIVSASDSFNNALTNLLPMTDYWPVSTVKNASSARRAVMEREYDIVVVNTPLPDEFGSKFAIEVCTSGNAGVLLLVKNEQFEEVYDRVMEHGVLTLAKPTSSQMIAQSMRTLCTMRERLRMVEEKQQSVEDKISEIRLVNHAKWLLIECLSMTEAEAQRYIEKKAMDARISKKEMAESIIKTYE